MIFGCRCLVLFALCLGTAAATTLIALTLDDTVKESDAIAVVVVEKIDKTGKVSASPLEGEEHVATARVHRTHKGKARKQIQVHFYPSSPAEFKLSVQHRYVLFLTHNNGRYSTVQGYRGVVQFVGDRAEVSMLDEAPNQSQAEFLKRIRSSVKRTATLQR